MMSEFTYATLVGSLYYMLSYDYSTYITSSIHTQRDGGREVALERSEEEDRGESASWESASPPVESCQSEAVMTVPNE